MLHAHLKLFNICISAISSDKPGSEDSTITTSDCLFNIDNYLSILLLFHGLITENKIAVINFLSCIHIQSGQKKISRSQLKLRKVVFSVPLGPLLNSEFLE